MSATRCRVRASFPWKSMPHVERRCHRRLAGLVFRAPNQFRCCPGQNECRKAACANPCTFQSAACWHALSQSNNSPGDSAVALETQILHFNGKTWAGYSYLWNADQTDAELVPAGGAELQLSDYDKSFGKATWHVHSRSECIRCHNSWAGGVLGFTLSQLNRPVRFLQ